MTKCVTKTHTGVLGNDQEHETIQVNDKIAKEDETENKYIETIDYEFLSQHGANV